MIRYCDLSESMQRALRHVAAYHPHATGWSGPLTKSIEALKRRGLVSEASPYRYTLTDAGVATLEGVGMSVGRGHG